MGDGSPVRGEAASSMSGRVLDTFFTSKFRMRSAESDEMISSTLPGEEATNKWVGIIQKTTYFIIRAVAFPGGFGPAENIQLESPNVDRTDKYDFKYQNLLKCRGSYVTSNDADCCFLVALEEPDIFVKAPRAHGDARWQSR